MARFRTELVVSAPVEAVWDFHADVANLVKVIPMNMRPHVVRLHERFEPGAEFLLRIGIAFWWTQSHIRIGQVDRPRRFTEEQVEGPFASFAREHRFEPLPDGQTRITDTFEYRLPHGLLGRLADLAFVRWRIREMLTFRRRVLSRAFACRVASRDV